MGPTDLATAPASTSETEPVTVTIPAHPRHLRIVRMVAATVASDAGYSIDDVDDVRMAADEVCAALLERPLAGPIRVTFRASGPVLEVTAEAPETAGGDRHRVPVDELRAAILGAVTDSYAISSADGVASAAFTKSGASPEATAT